MENYNQDGNTTKELAQPLKPHLKAQRQEIEYTFFTKDEDGMPVIRNNFLAAIPILIEDIALAVNQEDSEELPELAKSIMQEGMRLPIIVTYNNYAEFKDAVYGLSNRNKYDESKPYLALIGNQRLTIAKHNGYYSIDCWLVETGIECKVIERTYKDE